MQIYSAMIPVKESFSKKEFVRLLLEWNQGSPCDRMKGVNWDGGVTLCAGGMKAECWRWKNFRKSG